MQLQGIDWVIIVAYFAFTLSVGLWFRKRAETGLSEYFLSGRSLPWWIAGTSMVATTFAVDTPLVVTGFVAVNGLAGNWIWGGVGDRRNDHRLFLRPALATGRSTHRR